MTCLIQNYSFSFVGRKKKKEMKWIILGIKWWVDGVNSYFILFSDIVDGLQFDNWYWKSMYIIWWKSRFNNKWSNRNNQFVIVSIYLFYIFFVYCVWFIFATHNDSIHRMKFAYSVKRIKPMLFFALVFFCMWIYYLI